MGAEIGPPTNEEIFVFHRSENPRAKETWARVVIAFEELLQTPLRDVVEEIE